METDITKAPNIVAILWIILTCFAIHVIHFTADKTLLERVDASVWGWLFGGFLL